MKSYNELNILTELKWSYYRDPSSNMIDILIRRGKVGTEIDTHKERGWEDSHVTGVMSLHPEGSQEL